MMELLKHKVFESWQVLQGFHKEHPRVSVGATVLGTLAFTSLAMYYGHQNVFVKSPTYCYCISRGFFSLSLRWNAFRYGHRFSHQRIGDDPAAFPSQSADSESPVLVVDEHRRIVFFHDARASSPIVLSGIPRRQEDFQALRAAYQLPKVQLFTLNLAFERRLTGLSQLVADDQLASMLLYPTIDFYHPSFVDLVRAVHDLRHRPDDAVAVVHCKAGRGRSAAVVAAYLLAELVDRNLPADVVEVEAYLRSKRPQVKLGRSKRERLDDFVEQIRQKGSFELLYQSMTQEISQREDEIVNNNL